MPEIASMSRGARRHTRPKSNLTQGWTCLIGSLLIALQGCSTAPSLSPQEATQNQAKAAYLVGDYQRTLAVIMPLADAGEPWAQYTLGYMYYYGRGVQQDRQTAKQWIQSAAAKGYVPAQQALQRLSASTPTTEEENNAAIKPAPPDSAGQNTAPSSSQNQEQPPAQAAPRGIPAPLPPVGQPAPAQPVQPPSPPVQETTPAPKPADTPSPTTDPLQPSAQEKASGATSEPPPPTVVPTPPQTAAPSPGVGADQDTDRTVRAATPDRSIKNRGWIASQDPRHFTVQLISGDNEAAAARFIREHHLERHAAYYSTARGGKTWYSVIYGSFPDRRTARRALSQLPRALRRDSPRIRHFQGIQAQLGPSS